MDDTIDKSIADLLPFSKCSDFQLYLILGARKDFDLMMNKNVTPRFLTKRSNH